MSVRVRIRPLLATLGIGATACFRTYVPERPASLRTPTAGIAVQSLRILPVFLGIEVALRINARPGARLYEARLAVDGNRRCAEGVAFTGVELDGTLIDEGPVEVEGAHEITFAFGRDEETQPQMLEQWRATASKPTYLDLSVERDDGTRRCIRVPLLGARDAPRWRADPTSGGFSIQTGGRAYPLGLSSNDDIQPIGGFYERLGIQFDASRAWAEMGAEFTNVSSSRHLVLAAGADGTLWNEGPWALYAGLGYEAVFNALRADPNEPASTRYFLHGPRASLTASYALIENLVMPNFTTHPRLTAGRRTLTLELEIPVSIWFGSGNAPKTSVVPGFGLGLAWAF